MNRYKIPPPQHQPQLQQQQQQQKKKKKHRSTTRRQPIGITTYFRGRHSTTEVPSGRKRIIPSTAMTRGGTHALEQSDLNRGRRHLTPHKARERFPPFASAADEFNASTNVNFGNRNRNKNKNRNENGNGNGNGAEVVVAPWDDVQRPSTSGCSRGRRRLRPRQGANGRWNGLVVVDDDVRCSGRKHFKDQEELGNGFDSKSKSKSKSGQQRQRLVLRWEEGLYDARRRESPLTARSSYLVPCQSNAIMPHPKFGGGRRLVPNMMQTHVGSLLRHNS